MGSSPTPGARLVVLAHVTDKEQSDIIIMHHHLSALNYSGNIIGEQRIESYSTSQSELLVQGWDSEIIVTTFIQLFNTVFGRHTSQLFESYYIRIENSNLKKCRWMKRPFESVLN